MPQRSNEMAQTGNMSAESELKPEAPDAGIDTQRLGAWLAGRLAGAAGPMTVRQFSGGNANLVYLLTFADRSYVLRRPPFGRLAPGSHDMSREYRVLSRLHAVFPLAPAVFVLCEDPDVIGAPFLVMEYRASTVIRRDLPAPLAQDPAACERLGNAIIDTLADLHGVDAASAGLSDLGNPDGFLVRQVQGWERRWAAVADGPRPDMDRVLRWLTDNLPASGAASVLHNDFKLDNMLLDPADPSRCIGVVDWDMCTRGDPLVELGFLMNYWGEAGDPPEWLEAASMPTWHPGFPSRAEALRRYAARTGFDMAALDWHLVFGPWKLAVILQQIWARYQRGESRNPRFSTFGQRVDTLIRKADRLISR